MAQYEYVFELNHNIYARLFNPDTKQSEIIKLMNLCDNLISHKIIFNKK